jgi:CopG family nickel-responsive transcriptional regulator
MSELARFTVSIEPPLFEKLEALVAQSAYGNRSEFIRDLIRDQLVQRDWQSDDEQLGTISMVYDHHVPGLAERLTDEQHHFHGRVLCTTHVHLDEHLCAEMLMVRGTGRQIQALADRIRREKGVLHAGLAVGTTGATLRGRE